MALPKEEFKFAMYGRRPKPIFRLPPDLPPRECKRSRILIKPRYSTLGELDRLPTEILQLVFERLDCQSLARLSQASYATYYFVDSYKPFAWVSSHSPEIVMALSEARLANCHPASLIHASLSSRLCVCCGRQGNLLYLLTCQRCCNWCLGGCVLFQLITLREARRLFPCKVAEIEKLPRLQNRPPRRRSDEALNYCRIESQCVNLDQVFQIVIDWLHANSDATDAQAKSLQHESGYMKKLSRVIRCDPNRKLNVEYLFKRYASRIDTSSSTLNALGNGDQGT